MRSFLSTFRNQFIYFFVFLSGCSGLIYEVVWHRYLAILLGAQARATVIVLALFLGGISAGYACFGRWASTKRWNLLRVYALIELGLAFWAVIFPLLFRVVFGLTSKLYGTFGVNSLFIDVFVSALLLGLPTFLMGGTLPLLTQALSKDLENASEVHTRIYGFNTVGACFGSLLAGYVLIPMTGLSEALFSGALINIVVSGAFYWIFSRMKPSDKPQEPRLYVRPGKLTTDQAVLIGIGFISGFYLITLETILIRLMGLSTGSSNQNFTLIISIFIFSLGIGSLWVRRISRFHAGHLFWNQIGVSFFLWLLYLSGNYWAYGVHRIRLNLRDIPENFLFYQFLLGAAFLLLLIVPIGLAGLTLPISFHLLRDRKETLGERVGQLYGFNTLGCVFGALVGGYALFYFFNLDGLFKLCVVLCLATVAASAFLYQKSLKTSLSSVLIASSLFGVTFLGVTLSPSYNKEAFIQPFRSQEPIPGVSFEGPAAFARYLARTTDYLLYKDGPNTSVGIGTSKFTGPEFSRTIFVNGKSDGNTRGDYFTAVMLAHIPGLLSKNMGRVCTIGFGTGMTAGTLALYDSVQSIDVVEISGTIIENASLFDAYNGFVSKNPKIHFNEMDAFRFLEGTQNRFDVIVSEPSNPWVAGIENLYSEEFYEIASRKLTEDGIFVQWLHTYSFNDSLFRMVLKTIHEHFPYVSVFQLRAGDHALVASLKPFTREDLTRASRRFYSKRPIQEGLAKAGLFRPEAFFAREFVPFALVPALALGAEVHHLESPRLSNEAAKAFFAGSMGNAPALRRKYKEYFAAVDHSWLNTYLDGKLPSWEVIESLRESFCENAMSKTPYLCEETLVAAKILNGNFKGELAYREVSPREISSLGEYIHEPKHRFSSRDLEETYNTFDLFKKYYSPIAHIPTSYFLDRVNGCIKTTPTTNDLYGKCLLQKILILETLGLSNQEFLSQGQKYLEWFSTTSKAGRDYIKLKEAHDLLVRMMKG